jgi:hypothetical protein
VRSLQSGGTSAECQQGCPAFAPAARTLKPHQNAGTGIAFGNIFSMRHPSNCRIPSITQTPEANPQSGFTTGCLLVIVYVILMVVIYVAG